MLVFINYFSILGKPLYVVFFLQLIFKKNYFFAIPPLSVKME